MYSVLVWFHSNKAFHLSFAFVLRAKLSLLFPLKARRIH